MKPQKEGTTIFLKSNKLNNMKKRNILGTITGILILISSCSFAQSKKPTYVVNGDKLVKVETAKTATEAVKTKFTIDIKGTSYPVFKSSRGSLYILRTSKKTGKEYKQYINIEEPKK
ncbi:hypothetical protein Phi13:2_gp046 [Cellulophaga phage phi13:2]|uniref:Uncharacterized protein n=1 Tax=Cellulophaga phage phi13:2 TaxID=1328030 RepID=S0A2M7_9CAUD|nr:hypothetical protein Phi13:2_gp046 [Cellulophaga phage phi13:2]AGO49656.1 hypothetical protein Phi13:2_gp046 [Cellulophaga phage phi13:2]